MTLLFASISYKEWSNLKCIIILMHPIIRINPYTFFVDPLICKKTSKTIWLSIYELPFKYNQVIFYRFILFFKYQSCQTIDFPTYFMKLPYNSYILPSYFAENVIFWI